MNLSELFIRRRVATSLLMLWVVLAGWMGLHLLPVAPLPQVEFPTIAVFASLPGAGPATMAATVATPLERYLGRIAGVTEMTSSSTQGNTRIILQFDLSRSINGAARDVQAAINAARAQLPSDLPSNPTYRKVNPASAPALILALTSNTLSRGQMYDAASTILAQKISQVRGVGEVDVGGSSLPAIRVDLNPAQLNAYGISLEQVRTAIAAANAHRPKGAVEDGSRRWLVGANDQAREPSDYRKVLIAYRNGQPVALDDVAQVSRGVQDVRNMGLANGKPSVLLIIRTQPDANIIDTIARIEALLPELRAQIPREIDLRVVMDRSTTIRASLDEASRTLLISIALVLAVVFAFLRNGRAALIPGIAIPVSLMGTFGVMYLLGYSLDNLSLMALTIVTGFVVDDAIVVAENIMRHIENGEPPYAAAVRGAREVGFTVLSMSLSLVAVFIPILLMGGLVGRLFREFAATLSIAILVSLVVSLTLTPMLCARLLQPAGTRPPGPLARRLDAAYEGLMHGYHRSLAWALAHARFMLFLLLATVALNVYLYAVVPKGFFPQDDTGRIIGIVRASQSISFQAMEKKMTRLAAIVKSDPAVQNVMAYTGGGQRNGGFMFVTLKPLSQRPSAQAVIARLRPKLAQVPGASLFLWAAQDINIGGRPGNAQYQYTLKADNLTELYDWTRKLEAALKANPKLADVNSDQQNHGLETNLVIDRAAAARYGVTASAIDQTLYDAFGQRLVSTIYSSLNQYHVVMSVAPQYWQSPGTLNDIYVANNSGTLVPLSAFSHYATATTPLAVNHQGEFASTTLSFNLPLGVSLGQATQAIQETMARIGMPPDIQGGFQGTAKVFRQSVEQEPWLILAALLAIYIVLGILYESYVHPITILSTLPSAGVGAVLALMLFKTDFTIIALIGVFLLIGIVKKNAIMMIDVALDIERRTGKPPQEAIFEACLLRFRPIMMTTLTALLGALPLALGTGYGAEFRRPLGISIVGGLLVSQALTLYTTPVVYLYMDRLRLWVLRRLGRGEPRLSPL